MIKGIQPRWPAPTWVRSFITTREEDFNLGSGAVDLNLNRLKLKNHFNYRHEPLWLQQTHSNRVVTAQKSNSPLDADGTWTNQPELPCVVLTADCLPLLLTDTVGSFVCALHCGWRGILNGIIENAIQSIQPKGDLLAWMGPAIGPAAFEVGEDVRQPFMAQDPRADIAFKQSSKPNKWLTDLVLLAKLRLQAQGVNAIYGGEWCTYSDPVRFYSYRRDKQLGRMGTLIWLSDK